ncbi:MAG: hypothetical protein ACE5LU_22500 [Anaerolineae bacterium]
MDQPATFNFVFTAPAIPQFIILHLSGQQGENLGEISSQRVTENRPP